MLRLMGTNWDEGANLHPDERHMTSVVMDSMRAFNEFKPGELSVSDMWFAAGKSPLDPRRKDRLYVYGEFPHLVLSLVSRAADDGWPQVMERARTIGSVLDAYTILAVFLLSGLIVRSSIASLAAATLYAFLPSAIQQSNFFTVDVWLTSATIWCLLAATLVVTTKARRSALAWTVVAGGLAGLAAACKLPGLALIGAACLAAMTRYVIAGEKRSFPDLVAGVLLTLGAAAVVFRLASPFTFQGPGFFGLVPTENFIKGYREMSNLVLDQGFPPNWQWFGGYGPANALADLALWGIGLPTTLAVGIGIVVAMRNRAVWPRLLPLLAAAAVFVLYWLTIPNPALRYVSPALPAFCVLSVLAFAALFSKPWTSAVAALCVVSACLWGYGMVTLHTTTNNRVAASRWLWLNTDKGVVLANETNWDDGLPVNVRLPGSKDLTWAGLEDHFVFSVLGLEAPDTREKALQMVKVLKGANLLIISSERMRKPIIALHQRFPMSTAYYAMLADGSLCFEPIYRSKLGYPAAGFRFDDTDVQEPWSVYDHARVEIYRKLPCFDGKKVETTLLQALPKG
ncbi:hypothetical protein NKI61_14985 [Mesorhizobium sp. M0514]